MRAPIAPAEFLLEEGFHDLRTHQTVFEEVASFNFTTDCDLTEQNPSQVRCAYVSHNLLDTLGIPLRAGRGFTTAEDTPNGPLAALLSDALWRTRYGADPAVLGRTLSIDGRAAVVAGILPSTFELPNVYRADILLPQAAQDRAGRQPLAPHRVRAFETGCDARSGADRAAADLPGNAQARAGAVCTGCKVRGQRA